MQLAEDTACCCRSFQTKFDHTPIPTEKKKIEVIQAELEKNVQQLKGACGRLTTATEHLLKRQNELNAIAATAESAIKEANSVRGKALIGS